MDVTWNMIQFQHTETRNPNPWHTKTNPEKKHMSAFRINARKWSKRLKELERKNHGCGGIQSFFFFKTDFSTVKIKKKLRVRFRQHFTSFE